MWTDHKIIPLLVRCDGQPARPEKHVVWFVWASSIPQCIAQHVRKGISEVVAKRPIGDIQAGHLVSRYVLASMGPFTGMD